MKKIRKITAVVLALVFALGMSAVSSAADIPEPEITYNAENNWEGTLVIDENKTVLISGVTHENTGLTPGPAVRICGGAVVNLVFEGDNVLSANSAYVGAGIEVEEGSTVNIYGRDGSTLTVTGGKYSAGIGGIGFQSPSTSNSKAGKINIYSGTITATGGDRAAGIGSGFHSSASEINIYDGYITAYGTGCGAGIGSGYGTSGGALQDYQGNPTGAGVGFYNGGKITISGGTVRATSATGGDFSFDSFDISDPSTYPAQTNHAAGIGGGYGASSGNIVIEGTAVVTAIGSSGGAGIGSGRGTSKEDKYDAENFDCSVTIGGNATVTALATKDSREGQPPEGGAAIGLGRGCAVNGNPKGTIIIKENAQVTAVAESGANGIGSGRCVESEVLPAQMKKVEINKPAVVRAQSDGSRTPVYEDATNITVAFVDEDGKELQSKEYAKREMPECTAPTKEADDWYTYEFSAWSPEVVPVENEATYTAVYTATPIEYTATFVDENGETVGEVAYTVNTKSITPPAVPEKEDYHASWEKYTLKPGGITVRPVYTEYEPAVVIDDYEENFEIGYKDSMIYRATAVDVPEGAAIHWFVNDEDIGAGEGIGVEEPTDDYTVQAKIIGKDGSVLAESGVMNVTVRKTFFDRLIAFFAGIIDAIIGGTLGEFLGGIC